MREPLIDDEARRRAIMADGNVVVTAGAGTGKTTLLIDRMVHLLVREPCPVAVTDLVALTFTKKAAGEMKTRLRATLEALRGTAEESSESREALMRRSGLTGSAFDARVGQALRHLDRAQIGTIHGFAAMLLRLYPLEAGVDPGFEEAEEPEWVEHVERSWREWLTRELGREAPRAAWWQAVLERVDLEVVCDVAWALCPEVIPADALGDTTPCPGFDVWRRDQIGIADALLSAHPESRKIEQQLALARRVFEDLAGGRRPNPTPDEAVLLASDSNHAPLGWDREAFRRARRLVALAAKILTIDEELLDLLARVLGPFIVECRRSFAQAGRVSFDGLLVRARDLLRDRMDVREDLKRRFRAILIDEFQDTDPLQYEILLYVSEAPGRSATDVATVALEPGKLFIVGDPKQSIYGFRGADIEAYQRVVRMVLDQGGLSCTLATNFRSHGALLDAVNGVCSQLIAYDAGRQPAYDPIHPPPLVAAGPRPLVRIVRAAAVPFDAHRARAAEAESLARWVADEVVGRMTIVDRSGRTALAAARDVAILLRALTDVHVLLDAFRRHGIPYVVEGERHFFATQDVLDAVNVLRAVADPDDVLALLGVLRSPLGAVTDPALERLAEGGWLDYRVIDRRGDLPGAAPITLYRELAALHRETAVRPVADAVELVFDRWPLESVAAGGLDGDQAVANLDKLRRLAGSLAAEGALSLRGVVRQLERRIRDEAEESASPLADEYLDAVKIMSIHKAKGLEFPIVVLAGAHGGHEARGAQRVVRHPATGRAGLCGKEVVSLPGVIFHDLAVTREQAEASRLLYVAMTRARHRLVISGAPTGRASQESLLSMVERALETSSAAGVLDRVEVMEAAPEPAAALQEILDDPFDAEPYRAVWRARQERLARVQATPQRLTPTQWASEGDGATRTAGAPVTRAMSRSGDDARRQGTVVHAFLQNWDFEAAVSSWRGALAGFVAATNALSDEDDAARILAPFFESACYREIAGSAILGREVPLIMPWGDGMMEGVIDVIYEREGVLYVVDYKSDAVTADQSIAAAERYRPQAEVYLRAVREGTGRRAVFRCLFLRIGSAVDVTA